MKLSILNKKNNHKPNLQYASQGVILLLLVVRADDQWRKGGCSSFLRFWPLFVPTKIINLLFSSQAQKSSLLLSLKIISLRGSSKNDPCVDLSFFLLSLKELCFFFISSSLHLSKNKIKIFPFHMAAVEDFFRKVDCASPSRKISFFLFYMMHGRCVVQAPFKKVWMVRLMWRFLPKSVLNMPPWRPSFFWKSVPLISRNSPMIYSSVFHFFYGKS